MCMVYHIVVHTTLNPISPNMLSIIYSQSLFITGPIPVVNLVVSLVCLSICLSIHPFIWGHISVTTVRNFLILCMKIGYDLGRMPLFQNVDMPWWDAPAKMYVSEKGSNGIKIYSTNSLNTLFKIICSPITYYASKRY